jgi:hypothetical protein
MFNLSTINNTFMFNLPLDFMPDGYEERYMKLLKNQRKPFNSVLDYLNSTIQDISLPSITFPTVKQIMKRGKETLWKGDQNIYDLFDKTGTITFSNVDSNINYFIIMDCLMHHYLNTARTYDSNLVLTLVDENRKALYFMQYRSLIFTGQDGNKLAYNDQQIQTKTFTINFTYNYFDMEYISDKIDVIMNDSYGGHDLSQDIYGVPPGGLPAY